MGVGVDDAHRPPAVLTRMAAAVPGPSIVN